MQQQIHWTQAQEHLYNHWGGTVGNPIFYAVICNLTPFTLCGTESTARGGKMEDSSLYPSLPLVRNDGGDRFVHFTTLRWVRVAVDALLPAHDHPHGLYLHYVYLRFEQARDGRQQNACAITPNPPSVPIVVPPTRGEHIHAG